MRLPQTLFFLLTFLTTIHALALPTYLDNAYESSKELFKRKGGGGGGGRGGGSSGSSSSSSSGSSSGSRGSGSSSSGSSSSGSSSGSSRGGSGSSSSSTSTTAPRNFGGGYYGGGASAPYKAGNPRGSVAPYVLGGAALGIFPGLWLGSVYAYSYHGYYPYYNRTSNRNESKPIECLCDEYNPCGCDAKNETTYLDAVANDLTISRVADINGTSTLVVNGTLPNGTSTSAAAPGYKQGMLEMSGFWVVIAGVIYTVSYM